MNIRNIIQNLKLFPIEILHIGIYIIYVFEGKCPSVFSLLEIKLLIYRPSFANTFLPLLVLSVEALNLTRKLQILTIMTCYNSCTASI